MGDVACSISDIRIGAGYKLPVGEPPGWKTPMRNGE